MKKRGTFGMFYRVGKAGIQEIGRMEWEQMPGGVAVFDEDEWGGELKLKEAFSLEDPSSLITLACIKLT